MLSNKTYNRLKYFATIFLPALGSLYFGISEIWGFDRTPGVNSTINVVIAFFGILLAKSSKDYQERVNQPDGDLYVVYDPDGDGPHLKLGANSANILNKDKVQFEVKHIEPEIPSE